MFLEASSQEGDNTEKRSKHCLTFECHYVTRKQKHTAYNTEIQTLEVNVFFYYCAKEIHKLNCDSFSILEIGMKRLGLKLSTENICETWHSTAPYDMANMLRVFNIEAFQKLINSQVVSADSARIYLR